MLTKYTRVYTRILGSTSTATVTTQDNPSTYTHLPRFLAFLVDIITLAACRFRNFIHHRKETRVICCDSSHGIPEEQQPL